MDPVGGLIGIGIILAVGVFLIIFGGVKEPHKNPHRN